MDKILNEESLAKPIDEVFKIVCKIGKGSYGNVFKALHKETGEIVAIKQVPIESDLQEIIKEISIMQQCDSPYIVKYYGSYFKESNLFIVMEYCGAGSVSDLMKIRSKTLNEDEIASILQYTLKGLEYLHLKRKMHRDIKAGNILLNSDGVAKLADFGVAGQLSDTMAKRNTVIGSPYWMAPEVIQEIGYNCAADIWSLGITAIELAEGKPPYADIHPMRAIFMIPSKPPPSFRDLNKWSSEFIDFVAKCLVKNPQNRASASELLEHSFIKNAKSSTQILRHIIDEAHQLQELRKQESQVSTNDEYNTVKMNEANENTIKINNDTNSYNTMIEFESAMNTMVINDDDEDVATNTNIIGGGDRNHNEYDYNDTVKVTSSANTFITNDDRFMRQASAPSITLSESSINEFKYLNNYQQLQLQQEHEHVLINIKDEVKMFENDVCFIQKFNVNDLELRLKLLDIELTNEIEILTKKYDTKRKPIMDAIEIKKKKPQIF